MCMSCCRCELGKLSTATSPSRRALSLQGNIRLVSRAQSGSFTEIRITHLRGGEEILDPASPLKKISTTSWLPFLAPC